MIVSNGSILRPIAKPLSMLFVLAVVVVVATMARGGHELPVYPSYYPHEIAIETMPPERAAALLIENKIQAYLDAEPRFSGDVRRRSAPSSRSAIL